MMKWAAAFLTFSALCQAQERAWKLEEETADYWIRNSENELERALNTHKKLNMNVAKNVIMFLGDGMGIATVTAGRVMKGQLQGNSGEETVLAMDSMPHCGLSKTYSVNNDVSDSAVTATAYLCGVKANYGTIGLNGKVARGDCEAQKANHVNSILIDSALQGKSTGIVTTAHITHATPAGTYAHTADRFWYSDADLSDEAAAGGCPDIASQFLEYSDHITVAMGGGRKYMLPNTTADPEYPSEMGERLDGVDIIDEWQRKHSDVTADYVWNQAQFDAIDPASTDKLLGLFETSHMNYVLDREEDGAGEPTLAEMTDKAIHVLQKNTEGYFLLVEGARIDHAHHSNQANRALTEFVAFDEAIQRAQELTSEQDTLIVVTADHSHTLSMGGYSDRGNPILGLAPSNDDMELAYDGLPFTTLLYGTGPGYQGWRNRTFRDEVDIVMTADKDYRQQSAVPKTSATHAGEDVSIMASGPMAHLFHGVHEQSYIPYVMRYVSCVGDDQEHCNGGSQVDEGEAASTDEPQVAAVFLGNELDRQQASVALWAQFYIVVTIAVLIVATLARSKRSGSKSSSSSLSGEDNYAMSLKQL